MQSTTHPPLELAIALDCAHQLSAFSGAPNRSAGYEALAHIFVQLCRGNEAMSPEQQAYWLLDEALRCTKYPGPAGLRDLYCNKFHPVGSGYFTPLEGSKSVITCTKCQDVGMLGTDYCSCPFGDSLRQANAKFYERRKKTNVRKPLLPLLTVDQHEQELRPLLNFLDTCSLAAPRRKKKRQPSQKQPRFW